MSWTSAQRTTDAIKTISNLAQAYDKYTFVKESTDLARKAVDIQKLAKKRDFTWDKFKLFKNDEMEKILKQLRKLKEDWKTAAKTTPSWPPLRPEPSIRDLAKLAKMDGIDSQKAKAQMTKQLDWWNDVHLSAALALRSINAHEKRSAKIRKNMTITRDYMDVLYKAFRDIAKIPQPPSTAPQAQWLSLSQDAVQAKGIANSILGYVGDVDKNMAKFARETNKIEKEALRWSKGGVKSIQDAVKAEL